jgi:hypothetical protein
MTAATASTAEAISYGIGGKKQRQLSTGSGRWIKQQSEYGYTLWQNRVVFREPKNAMADAFARQYVELRSPKVACRREVSGPVVKTQAGPAIQPETVEITKFLPKRPTGLVKFLQGWQI